MTKRHEGNSGLVARNVTAEMIVQGYKPTATKTTNIVQGDEVRTILDRLRGAVGAIDLQPGAREVVDAEVEALSQASLRPAVDAGQVGSHIRGLSEKLKMVGVLIANVATIAEPLKKIIDLLHIPDIAF